VSPLATVPLGPFTKGVIQGANPAMSLGGALRYARNAVLDGLGRMQVRPGTAVALTLKDDQGTPANVTSVVAIIPFGDGALAVGHSTVTSKFYLYRLDADLSGWYNAGGAFQANANAEPVAVLWTSAANPRRVHIAEGLGVAYIAHSDAAANFRSKQYSVAGGLTNFDANLRGAGSEATYFRGFAAFQQHLWGWGYGSEAANDNDRPEFLRFSQPNFAAMIQADGFTVGHRVRSQRERIIGATVAGGLLYVGTNYALWPIHGFNRSSWDKSQPLSDSYGFASSYGAIAANNWLYYWSPRGLLRVAGLAQPEPLFDALPDSMAALVDPSAVVLAFDYERDQVLCLYQDQTSGAVSRFAAWDVRREVWLGPDSDIGLGVRCAALIQPVNLPGPAGAPTFVSVTGIGNTAATVNFTLGDPAPGVTTHVQVRVVGSTTWVEAGGAEVPATSKQVTGLLAGTNYEGRLLHRRNGLDSAFSATFTFTTTTDQLLPPTGVTVSFVTVTVGSKTTYYVRVAWANSGETDVFTEVFLTGPTSTPPGTGTLPLVHTADPGVSSYQQQITLADQGEWWAEVRHTKVGFTPSAYAGGPATAEGPIS